MILLILIKNSCISWYNFTDYNQDSKILYPFWDNIKQGYDKFEKEHKPLNFKATQKGYVFEQ
jgi:murein L,D-transpeptidase YafK